MNQPIDAMRTLAQLLDAQAEALWEAGFRLWCDSTVFPAAVNRLITEIGARE